MKSQRKRKKKVLHQETKIEAKSFQQKNYEVFFCKKKCFFARKEEWEEGNASSESANLIDSLSNLSTNHLG
jgi:hypothetical protein